MCRYNENKQTKESNVSFEFLAESITFNVFVKLAIMGEYN